MASPDIWRGEIIPRLDRFVSGPLTESAIKQITDKPKNQTLGFAVCRMVIAESHGVAKVCKKLNLGDFVPETVDCWFPYTAVAVHLATRLEQGAILDTPMTEYYDSRDPIKPSETPLQMLHLNHDLRNLTTFLAIDSTGRMLVEHIVMSSGYFRREEDALLDVVNRLVSLGGQRFNKYLERFLLNH